MSEEVNHTTGYARKTSSALMSVWKRRHMSWEAKVTMYEGTVEPTLLYGCKCRH